MNLAAKVGLGAAATCALVFFAMPRFSDVASGTDDADVYPIPTQDAYVRLYSAHFPASARDGMALSANTSVSGDGRETVVWDSKSRAARFSCVLGVVGLSPAQTLVKVTCHGGGLGDNSAQRTKHNALRNRVIEMVDATLNRRAFDPQKADGATAAHWPSDDADGSLDAMSDQSLKALIAQTRAVHVGGQQPQQDRAVEDTDPAVSD
jgi:hypothetical protein